MNLRREWNVWLLHHADFLDRMSTMWTVVPSYLR